MAKAKDLAAKIDAMTLDQLKAAADDEGMPTAGGEYDTKEGWARRLGMDRKSRKFVNIWRMMEEAGRIKKCRGRVGRSDHQYTTILYHCPTLAKKMG